VTISNGYPHYTHLLALKCSEDAIAAGKYTIRKDGLIKATVNAAESAEGAYQNAIRSASLHGDFYRLILVAAARMSNHEFNAKELRDEICKISGKQLLKPRLSNFYSTLIADGVDTVLRRVSKGMYCFNNPRFPSFIRMVNNDI
jgi:hypothetical protein